MYGMCGRKPLTSTSPMPEEPKKDTRPWWELARVQGVGIMVIGFGMLAFHVPYAGKVIEVGAGWALGGSASAYARSRAAKLRAK